MSIAVIAFCGVFVVTLLCVGLGLAFLETRQRKHVRAMLATAKPVEISGVPQLLREPGDGSGWKAWLQSLPFAPALESMLQQSLLDWELSKFAAVSVAAFAVGCFAGWKLCLFGSAVASAAACAGIATAMPTLYVLRRRAKTLHAFEKQFPDALDFLSRSMRAGHGFTISLETLGQDAAEPIASALRRVSHELQLGSPLSVALGKMTAMVPLVDVRFFVSTVLLQQESGGNLSEILSKLAHVIRERFQLKGQVKALSAHGRITGLVLLLMPVIVTMILLATSPDYFHTLTNDSVGRALLYGAVGGQILAYLAIKKIVNIRV